jgi:biopolymer transport protein ExbD
VLKRPSTRRRSSSSDTIEINLVPMMDALVTMIAFILFSLSFLSIVSIESPVPIASPADMQKKLDQKPLQLTLSLNDGAVEIWSPFDRIRSIKVPALPDGQPDVNQIHERLVEIKTKFPDETKVILSPSTGSTYDVMISVMDVARMLQATDAPIYRKNPTTGVSEPLKVLFPEVIFGNILGND